MASLKKLVPTSKLVQGYLPADVVDHALAHLLGGDAEEAAEVARGLQELGHVVPLGGVLYEHVGAPVARHALKVQAQPLRGRVFFKELDVEQRPRSKYTSMCNWDSNKI